METGDRLKLACASLISEMDELRQLSALLATSVAEIRGVDAERSDAVVKLEAKVCAC